MAAGCGTGLSAKCCEAAGCDLIFIYNTARYRMAGASSLAGMLAYGDANAVTLEMARQIVPVVKRAPVIGGINGTDPFRHWPHYLTELRNHGVSGVLNWPLAIADAAKAVNPEILVFAHGGPISTRNETEYVLHKTRGVEGFLGGSAMERIPNEMAQTAAVREFKSIVPPPGNQEGA